MSLFGSSFGGGANTQTSSTQNAQKPSLFGGFGQSQNNSSQPQSQGLFGQSTNNNTQGQNQNQPQGLFGQSTNNQQNTQSTGLFGQSSNTQNQPQNQSQTLFGGGQSTTQNQNQGGFGGGFGGSFGSTQQQQNQNNPSQQFSNFGKDMNSVFSNPNNQLGQTQSNQQQQQQQPSHLSASLNLAHGGLGNSTIGGAISEAQQRDLAISRLQSAGLNASAREKTIPEQFQALERKWSPDSPDTLLQTYLYNNVASGFAPFYHPSAGESEAAYEKALAEKPSDKDIEGTWVPVLCRGFHNLGQRVEHQVLAVRALQQNLHAVNNSLTGIMEKHRQEFSVSLERARRQHVQIAERTLRLATKVQVLRNRGYALTSAEEALRRQLKELESRVLDPGFGAREEEIWARMVSLRERARWLEEEGGRMGEKVMDAGGEGLPEYVVAKTKGILRDYDEQLQHLGKELVAVRKEYQEWQESRR